MAGKSASPRASASRAQLLLHLLPALVPAAAERIAPAFVELSKKAEHAEVTFLKIDVDNTDLEAGGWVADDSATPPAPEAFERPHSHPVPPFLPTNLCRACRRSS